MLAPWALAGLLTVRARYGAAPIPDAQVSSGAVSVLTDERGEATLELPEGEQTVRIVRNGFLPAERTATVRPDESAILDVQLERAATPTEVTTVFATRSDTIVEDQPTRIETVPEEEIEENATTAPGNLSTLLAELAGVQVQTTSASLGAAALRLQGLPGRYTQVLLDGLPVFGEAPDGFGLLQVPPLDLAQVEVIKGTASALYGGRALGGVLNLVSRRPPGEADVMVSASSLGGADALAFVPGKIGDRWGYSFLGGVHGQRENDVDDDGWVDVAGYRRGELRPRFFWGDTSGRSLLLTVGASYEHREGGTADGGLTPAGTPFSQELTTRRGDLGLTGRFLLGKDKVVLVRAVATSTEHDLIFGGPAERDRRSYGLSEASISGSGAGHTWVAGAAIESDVYRAKDVSGLDYTDTAPAVFVQDEYAAVRWLTISASGRADLHDDAGTLLGGKVAALIRPGAGWRVRLSAGTGEAPPVPFTEETEEIGHANVLPLGNVRPEGVRNASLDVGWSGKGFEANGTLFTAELDDPLVLRASAAVPGRLEIVNATGPTRTAGAELLLHYTYDELHAIASYTYLRSNEIDPASGLRVDTPLVPRHAGEIAVIWEIEGKGRIGGEASYVGRQRLDDNPYRTESVDYVEVNLLGEIGIGHARLFVNALNATDVLQTKHDPLVRPAPAFDGRWTTDAWAPLAGRTFNAGVRWEF
jgi:outer membrane receptor for ferrienterochelin and colicins